MSASQPTTVPFHQRAALSIKQTGDYIGVGRTGVYALIAEGKLASRKIGSRRVVLRESCDKLLSDATA